MAATGHSKLGASGFDRWGACPGSVRLSVGMPNKSSIFAQEGTAAHTVGERGLVYDKPADFFLNERIFLEDGSVEFVVDREMADAVQVYLDAVNEERRKPHARIFVEQRFHLAKLHDDLWGTSDCCVYHPEEKILHVFDYKHGQGVPVDVIDNGQLKYYGLGALLELGFPAEKVVLHIVQPRCPHPDGPHRQWEIDAMDLLDFAADLIAAAKATEDPNAPLKSGDHCRWCPAAPLCPKLQADAQDLAKEEFGPHLSYDPEKLSAVLEQLPVIEAWIKSVREFAYGEAEHGRCPPRWKLVPKHPTRKWMDEGKTVEFLHLYGMDDKDIFDEPSLKSPAAIEKILGKKNADAIKDLVVSVSSGATLAPESDRREAVKKDAKSEFDAVG